ncbi:DUF6090 family protein [Algoriphagus namhaensis]|uniref:DUF6090 family protein n=1 Tax=Algoriphagus namhaensis TaxID=915353 RepID=A0ABV8AQB1_9BACT
MTIGILIALQINTWNEQKKASESEQEILANLIGDFLYNDSILINSLEIKKEVLDKNFQILDYTGTKPKPATREEFDALLSYIYTVKPFKPRNGFLDEVLSSGRLGVIQDANLRNKLSLWKSILEDVEQAENSAFVLEFKLIDFIIENGVWLNIDKLSVNPFAQSFPESGFDLDNRELLNSLEFENLIENRLIFSNALNLKLESTKELNEEIIALLQKNLK